MSADPELDIALLAANGSDLAWWTATGMCGGCGREECHEGPCGDVPPAYPDPMRDRTPNVCHTCPHRIATGQVPA